ncbi:MAG: hypothetical protein ABSH51_04765 [Solirubrobacteraceae bacterium]|jgi:hypothetical protein
MESQSSSTTQYKPVTVDVPEDRVAEFHAFFARFLAGPMGRGRRGRHGRPDGERHGHRHGHGHGHGCAGRRETTERSEPATASTEL